MLTNTKMTYYHKTLDENRLEKWNKIVFDNVWWYGNNGSSIYKGYAEANDVEVRIPLEEVSSIDIFAIGDMMYKGEGPDIIKTSELDGKAFAVRSYTINLYGGTPHIHLGGK